MRDVIPWNVCVADVPGRKIHAGRELNVSHESHRDAHERLSAEHASIRDPKQTCRKTKYMEERWN